MNLVTVISTTLTNAKRIVKVLRFGKSDVQTAQEISPYGFDSNPIKNMVAVYAPTAEKGKTVIIGYINKNQKAATGETRFFSTDDDGAEQFYAWLKKDGTMEIGGDVDNMVRYSKLKDAFDELKADHNNLVATFNQHVHTGGTMSGSTGLTGSPEVPSVADITPAKIDEIKTL